MNRRNFLFQSGIAGAGLILKPQPFQVTDMPKIKAKKVIIIGAGFSGLAAAETLMKQGIQVVILESRSRIGGRVFTHQPKTQESFNIELGAEWVGDSHHVVKKYCKDLGLNLLDNRFESHLTFQGEYKKPEEWKLSQQFDDFWAQKEKIWAGYNLSDKKKLDKTDWWHFLKKHNFEERDILLRELMDSTDFGESIRHTSAYMAFAEYAESSPKNEMDLKIEGGNFKLAEKLAALVGYDKIFLNHAVQLIDQNQKGKVSVQCANGKVFVADKVICSIPTAAMEKINWTPALPGDKMEAIQALQYARIGKFPMVFKERFWKDENFDMITDTPAHYFYHGTKNQAGQAGVLICYAVGEKADSLASISMAQRKEIILNALKPAFGNVEHLLEDSLMYYWGKDAISYGAYAFYAKNQWFPLQSTLKQSFGSIHFAGEHLADWQGFMEGALQSGIDAANEL